MGINISSLHNTIIIVQDWGNMYTLIRWEMNDCGEWKPFRLAVSPDRKVLEPMCKEHCEIIEE